MAERTTSDLDQRREETYAIRDMWKSAKASQQRFFRSTGSAPDSTATFDSAKTFDLHQNSRSDFERRDKFYRKRLLDDIPIHTAITERPKKDSSGKMKFNALNKKLLCRLPNIFDPPVKLPSYANGDIGEWKNEILKNVPERPHPYITRRDPSAFRSSTAMEPLIRETTRDSLCMFRPTRVPYKGKGKEYMIDPEWSSEHFGVQTPGRRHARLICSWMG